jgi:hypothetical protein
MEASTVVFVSGAEHTTMALPSPNNSSCGTTDYVLQSFRAQNFTYVEMKNLADSTVAVSVTVDGPSTSSLSLFAYASPTPPSSRDDVNQCMVSDEGNFEPGTLTPHGPSLSVDNGKALVVGPRASAFVMLATKDLINTYKVTARTVGVEAVADRSTITISTTDGTVPTPVLVSGLQRTTMPLPAPTAGRASSCGTRDYAVQSPNGENFAYLEMRNPGDSAAAVSVTVDGPHPDFLSLFAYASPTPPSSKDDVNRCMVSDEGVFDLRTLRRLPPSLSVTNGKVIVVGPHASTFVMLATNDRTGPFKVNAQTVGHGSVVDTPSITIPSSATEEATTTVLVSGAQRTTMPLPAPNADSSSSCGHTGYAVQSPNGQNFAYVEVKNPGDSVGLTSVTVEGANPSSLSFFAYASPTPPSSKDDVNQCMVSDEGQPVPGTSTARAPALAVANGKPLVVAPHASAFLMLATDDHTGPFNVKTLRH